ncbi:MAG: hypothetical protein E7231_18505 [Cellulosilyticum sp.]|nr:hypothetical protein [Cellulosilyticum sp.]
MNEIIGYFFHPEGSIEVLLEGEQKRRWQDGILKWILVAILSGLLTIVIYKIVGVDLESLTDTYGGRIIQGLSKNNINEGMIWLSLAGVSIGETLISAIIRAGLWTGLLYTISKFLKDTITLRDIVNISVYAILTWVTARLLESVVLLIIMISPFDTLNQMLLGLGMLLGYWYLILFMIGYSMATDSTFFKGATVVVIGQGIIWGIANIFPVLQTILI